MNSQLHLTKPYPLATASPARGYIYDRNGVLLADNYPVLQQL